MTYYSFSPSTNEYRGSREPQIDPLETEAAGEPVYMGEGRYETSVAPVLAAGQVPVWDGNQWNLKADHRGEVWYTGGFDEHPEGVQASALTITITDIGDPAVLGLLANEPLPPNDPVYPDMQEQFNLLWDAMESGEIPKATAFHAAIKTVKDANL